MPRTKIDIYKTSEDARIALSALRDVGLNPGDVAGAWCAEDGRPSDGQILQITPIGPVELSGWLAAAANHIARDGRPLTVRDLLEGVTSDATEIARIEDALVAKGGIIGVRARDTLSLD